MPPPDRLPPELFDPPDGDEPPLGFEYPEDPPEDLGADELPDDFFELPVEIFVFFDPLLPFVDPEDFLLPEDFGLKIGCLSEDPEDFFLE